MRQRGGFEQMHENGTAGEIEPHLRAVTRAGLRHDWQRNRIGVALPARVRPNDPHRVIAAHHRAAFKAIYWHVNGIACRCDARNGCEADRFATTDRGSAQQS
jgi:hypothetical protein